MLGSAMNIWCSRQQMRHCTSLKSLRRPPSGSVSSTLPLALGPRLPCFDFPGKGPLMLLSRLSVLAPSCCSSEVGRHTSRRIWTAALSWGKIEVYRWHFFICNKVRVCKRERVYMWMCQLDVWILVLIEGHSSAPPWWPQVYLAARAHPGSRLSGSADQSQPSPSGGNVGRLLKPADSHSACEGQCPSKGGIWHKQANS